MKQNLEQYRQKLVSATEASQVIEDGSWVDFGWSASTSVYVDAALSQRVSEYTKLNLVGGVCQWELAIFKADPQGKTFVWNTLHASGIERKRVNQVSSFYIPLRYSELPRWYRDGQIKVDVAVMQVTPMDENGYFNFGPSASHQAEVVKKAKVVIVEVNENLPYANGNFENCNIHLSKVDYVVEGDNPKLKGIGSSKISEVDDKVANLILEEIPNGACLQLGIGGMPNAVGQKIAQSDLQDLGVHTEMYVDAFYQMDKAGKITGKYKGSHVGKQVYAFAGGSSAMYDYMHKNDGLYMETVEWVNSAAEIAKNDNFISINNCLNVDLYGQVASEASGTRHISGAGGQLDFVLGAYLSKGGKSFICLPSTHTDKEGKLHSNILPVLEPGTVITVPRPVVHWVVTEYGKFNLKGKSTWERVNGLISIAHPDFREELRQAAAKMGIFNEKEQ